MTSVRLVIRINILNVYIYAIIILVTEKRLILTTITDKITYNEDTDTISVKLKPTFEYLRQLKLQNKGSFKASADELYGTLENRSESAQQALKNEQQNLNQIKVYGTLKRLVNTKKEPTYRGSKI